VSIFKKLSHMLNASSPVKIPKPEGERLAAAVLMVEVAANDGEISRIEREQILHLLEHKLGLSSEEAIELFVEALGVRNESNQMVTFTREIKNHFDEGGRENILEMMWEVAFADGKADSYESNLLRRVTGLLYISDVRSGQIRKNVMAKLGL